MRTRIALTCLLLAAPSLHAAPDTLDAAFVASAGQVFLPNHYGGVASVLVQPDVFGSNEMRGTVNGNPLQMPLIRFNPDGPVDNTFYADNEPTGSDGGFITTVRDGRKSTRWACCRTERSWPRACAPAFGRIQAPFFSRTSSCASMRTARSIPPSRQPAPFPGRRVV